MSLRYAMMCLLCVTVALSACNQPQQEQTIDQTVSVKTVVVRPTDRELVSTYTGSLEGERQANLYSKLAEAVDSVWVKEGDRVKVNQVILSLDQNGPTSNYREARSTYENAEKNYRKMKYLYEEGAVSESTYDDARTAYEVAQANFEAVRKLVQIESPIAGLVTAIDVSPGDFVNVGKKLATVAVSNKLRVRFDVNTSEISYFRLGGQVKVTSDAVDGFASGTISSIASSADPLTRAFEVEALLDNPDGRFQPGMFVKINYIMKDLPSVITVPRRSIVVLDDKPTVYTTSNNAAVMNQVSLGPDLRGDVVIASGLKDGDTVITVGQDYVEDGTKLTITEVREQ